MSSTQISPHILLPEPKLAFHPERASDTDVHPLRGLVKFGPYSKGLIPDPIRVATMSPFMESKPLYDFMKQLRSSYAPKERKSYLPNWPGFQVVFGTHMAAAAKPCHEELDEELDSLISGSANPHVVLAERLLRKIHLLAANRHHFDVLFIYLPARWAAGFEGGEGDDFDLHDYLKASAAAIGIPIQIVREDSALAYSDRASVMWRIGIALYTKAGGVPWKLADADPNTAHIGISYAIRAATDPRPRFVTCCSQVFDSEGAGLEFIAYDANEVKIQQDNPFLSRNEMFKVMTRSVDLYRRRHGGRTPRNVVVHKTSEFKREEIEGCMEALHLCEAVDLVQIVADVGWRGVKIEQTKTAKGDSAHYPVSRGTLLPLGPKEALLWAHGDVQGIAQDNKSYFQGGKGTPRPIKMIRHAGHGPWHDTALATLALSKMDWNNDSLYDPLPVTIGYARTLARIVKRMQSLGTQPYQFRFFM